MIVEGAVSFPGITGLTMGRVSGVHDLRDHGGVVGSTSTNNLTAFQSAVNAIAGTAAKCGTIHVPAGTWYVNPASASVTVPDGVAVKIVGEGPASVVRVRPDCGNYGNLFYAPVSNVIAWFALENLTIDQDPASNTTCDCNSSSRSKCQFVTDFSYITQLNINKCHFRTGGVNAINVAGQNALVTGNVFNFVAPHTTETRFDNSTVYLEMARAQVTGNRFEAVAGDYAGGCVEFHGPQSIMSGNHARYYRALAYVVTPYSGDDAATNPNKTEADTATAFIAEGNTILGGASVFELNAPSGQAMRGVKIKNNIAHGMNQGFRDDANSSGVLFGTGSFEDFEVSDNYFEFQTPDNRNTAVVGLYGTNVGISMNPIGNMTRGLIASNTIKNAPEWGIGLGQGGDPTKTYSHIRIEGNHVIDAGGNTLKPGIGVGIYLSGVLVHVRVDNNTVESTGGSALVGYASVYVQTNAPPGDGTWALPVNCSVTRQRDVAASGSFNRTIPASMLPAAPTTLADVIAIVRGLGFSA